MIENTSTDFSLPFAFRLFNRSAHWLQDGNHRPEWACVSASDIQSARSEICSWPYYRRTPLHHLDGLARATGVSAIYYKDEGYRFGLGSFKALGGAYAVFRILQAHVAATTGE